MAEQPTASIPAGQVFLPVHVSQIADGRQEFTFNMSSIINPPPKPSFDNPLALSAVPVWEDVEFDDRFDDLQLVCKDDQQIMIDRALLCRLSPILLKAFGDKSVTSYEMKDVEVRVIKELIEILTYQSSLDHYTGLCRCTTIDASCFTYQLLHFAQQYQVHWLLYTIKNELISQRIRQHHFDLDLHFKLDLHQRLLQRVYQDFDSNNEVPFTDPKIYQEIGNFIFKVPTASPYEKALLRRRQSNFAGNFRKSGFPFEEVEFSLDGAPIPLALLILGSSTKMFNYYCTYWCASGRLVNDNLGLEELRKTLLDQNVSNIRRGKLQNEMDKKARQLAETQPAESEQIKKSKIEEKKD